MSRILRDSIGYLVVIGFCVLMLAWGIPTYTPAYPGYGASAALVPNVAVSVMLVMALVSLARVWVAIWLGKPIPRVESEFPEDMGENDGFTQVGRVNLLHLASIILPSVILLVSIDYVGYEIASILFLLLIQFVIGSRRWVQSVVIAVVLTAVLFIVMRYGFGVPVPGPQYFL